ncbi:hypothetical protein Tco_0952175 [Tanacetum coccineum]|uniref:Uncharacterized protein n=1 Tax=Tanacetum coccineum TaxID=301880 RepID=A0ABQ5DW91_9ASTR
MDVDFGLSEMNWKGFVGALGVGNDMGVPVENFGGGLGKKHGNGWNRIGPSKSSRSLSIAHKWAVVID